MTELALVEIEEALEFDAYFSGPSGAADKLMVIEQVASNIGRLHKLGWVHGSLGLEHMLIQPDGTVTLIDFEKSSWRPYYVARDLKRFWRRTEGCLDDDQKARFVEVYEATAKRRAT